MPNVYRPKVTMKTVQDLARRMASTKSGKAISETKFKKFMKTDKDLRRTALRSPSTHMTQYQTQRFLGKVAKKIGSDEKMKLSMFARKQGIKKIRSQGNVSAIGIKKVYQTGAKEEIAAEMPQGPTKAEQERQQRIERGRKILHQRERADEVRKSYQKSPEQNAAQKSEQAYRSPQLSHASAAGRVPQAQGAQLSLSKQLSDDSQPPRFSEASSTDANALILPFYNKSRIQGLALLGEKLEETLHRALAAISRIQPLYRVATIRALRKLGWEEGRIITTEFAKKIASRLEIDYVFFGTITPDVSKAHVEVYFLLFEDNSVLKIADFTDDFREAFEMEKKLTWQIQAFFEEKDESSSEDSGVTPPSASEAIDLPI